MHIPRFFLATQDVQQPGKQYACVGTADPVLGLQVGDELSIVNPQILNQVRNVLRLKPGDQLHLLDGQGALAQCTLKEVTKQFLSCSIHDLKRSPDKTPIKVTMVIALLKGERFDWALQKMTELGVSSIVPVITARTVVKYSEDDAKGAAKLGRWQSILKEAAEQCERMTVPHIVAPRLFSDWISSGISAFTPGGNNDEAFICAERIQGGDLKDILLQSAARSEKNSATTDTTIFLHVGPEGGFTQEEIERASNAGIKPVSLGSRILRSETAAIYALAQTMWCLEK